MTGPSKISAGRLQISVIYFNSRHLFFPVIHFILDVRDTLLLDSRVVGEKLSADPRNLQPVGSRFPSSILISVIYFPVIYFPRHLFSRAACKGLGRWAISVIANLYAL